MHSRAVAYYRVSTSEQGRSGLGLDAQRGAVEHLLRSRQLPLLACFTEVESGARCDRPQLGAALHHAKLTGSVLVIAKLDRLSRNAAFLLTLRDSGVRFVAADVPDANDLTIGVLAVVAQAEREAISRRTTEALESVRQRLAADGFHVSQRSGRTINRLGNPNGSAPLQRSGKGNVAALYSIKEAARQRACDLKGTLIDLQAEGIITLGGLAAALNERGILTARGGRWHRSSVAAVMERLRRQDTPLPCS